MPLILGTNSIKDTGYDVANSVRFNKADAPALKRNSMGTATNRKKWTLSMWVKRSTTAQAMLASFDGAASYFQFQSGGQLEVNDVPGSTFNYRLVTNAVYRDVSAWMHIVVAYDSTQGTDSNRLKLYVNGEQPSLGTATYPSLNFEPEVNSTGSHKYGSYDDSTDFAFDGYFAEIVFIDGSQLDPTSFGEFDEDSGIWKPIDVSGLTFGNNGHYLDFEDSGNLGNDANGGTDFDENNITATDQTTDTCTNNFATFNPLGKANLTYAEGNTKITNASGAHNGSLSTLAVNKGKWYYEVKFIDGSQTRSMAGICKVTDNLDNEYVGDTANSYGYFRSNGNKFNNSSSSSYGSTPSNNSIISVAFDADNGTLWFGLNGTWQNSATKSEIEAGTTTNSAFSSITMDDFFAFACSGEDATCQANFGSPSYAISSGNTDGNGYGNFEYEVPSGYYALCTKNLAEYG
jgi:hypothetical protein